MNKLLLLLSLAAFSPVVAAQNVTTSSYPVYERVMEPSTQYCREETYRDARINPVGAVVGGVIGYHLGREHDRHRRSYVGYGGYGYERGRGSYYNDYMGGGRYYESRAGRNTGAVIGAMVGGSVVGYETRTICEPSGPAYYREVMVGYRIVTTYPDGTVRERFQPTGR